MKKAVLRKLRKIEEEKYIKRDNYFTLNVDDIKSAVEVKKEPKSKKKKSDK